MGRTATGAAVVLFHLLLILLLLQPGGVTQRAPGSRALSVFDAAPVPTPPPEPEPSPARGSLGAPAARADPQPRAAPPPIVQPQPSSPLPPVAGQGGSVRAGAADEGSGSGAAGAGAGRGAGGIGDGTGGGAETPPRRIAGRIDDADYPRGARRLRAEGRVVAAFTVTADGRARDCRIHRSSGNDDLDATTCRLIESRFRFEPARDAWGTAIPFEAGWQQDWWFEGRRGRRG